MSFNWSDLPSGLRIREDEFSWQGAYVDDPRFFLRRDKFKPDEFSDFLLGGVGDEIALSLLVEFLLKSGGLNSDRLLFRAIGAEQHSKKETVARFDRIDNLVRGLSSFVGKDVSNSHLDLNLGEWRAVFCFV